MSKKNLNTKVVDPVCEMEKPASQMQFERLYQNTKVYLCSKLCLEAFDKYPDRYIKVVLNKLVSK